MVRPLNMDYAPKGGVRIWSVIFLELRISVVVVNLRAKTCGMQS
jgi:hypothetical protein